MNLEKLFYDLLIKAETGDELNRWISEINDEFITAVYRVVETNNFWEEHKGEVTE